MENQNLSLTETSREYLREGAKWAYFLSILGFIGIGLMVIMGLFMGSIMASVGSMAGGSNDMGMMGGSFFTILYILMAALYFFPVYYLYKFSSNAKAAVDSNDDLTLETALGYLKSHYKFIGILTIVVLSIYLLFFIGAMVAFSAAM